ncbi:parallel beta-helix domain-containing protein [Altererythrobacter sp. GH1-8]|uniref:parallel beta-helix domain-containing protein n=1 Tax=Altererythrobacter sp. GH1-8 TaxID=3349333 RepID=UPI00374DE37F
MRFAHSFALMAACLLFASSCSGTASDEGMPLGDPGYEEKLMAQLLDAKPGDVITIPEGKFPITRSLSLTVDGVTIRGAGMDKSILSFKGQVAGAEGLLVTANNFTIENLAIEDTIGDALKISEGNTIVIRGVRVEWTDGYKTENGAYGIYPVQTTNVLMEDNVAIGASDAGLYIGQSKNVIVRRNRAEYNVAGIEIENTIDADVYENIATNNTGGILVFNMPNLAQEGKRTRVFNNKVIGNNTENFGHEGTPVASVPAGSGIVVSSNDQVEIFNNEIRDNNTANIIVSSVYSTNYSERNAVQGYDPYPEGIFIYGNDLSGGGSSPDGLELKTLKTVMFGINGAFPDVLWDGYFNPTKTVEGKLPLSERICIDNGDVGILNVDGPNDFANPSTDPADHRCTLPKLPAVELELTGE